MGVFALAGHPTSLPARMVRHMHYRSDSDSVSGAVCEKRASIVNFLSLANIRGSEAGEAEHCPHGRVSRVIRRIGHRTIATISFDSTAQ
jgi:hypothetical protein